MLVSYSKSPTSKFTRGKCQSCYVGERKCHFPTRITKYLQTSRYKNLQVFHHLEHNSSYRNFCYEICFDIIDQISSLFRWKLEEVPLIMWLKPISSKWLIGDIYNSLKLILHDLLTKAVSFNHLSQQFAVSLEFLLESWCKTLKTRY